MCQAHLNIQTSEAFAEKLLQIFNYGGLNLLISLGHRTGLFDVMVRLPFSTVEEISDASGLNERYVREWLAGLTAGDIIQYDPVINKYKLPEEYSIFLSRKSDTDNLAVFSQYFAVLGSVEDEVVECFKNGGGVPYSSYKRFHHVMAEDSNQSIVAALNDVVLPVIPGIKEKLEEGINVLDIGCGRGKALNTLARIFPKSRFTGYDLSSEAIEYAREEAGKSNLKNVKFEIRDLTDFHLSAPDEEYDFITSFDAIHDQARPDNVLSGIYKSLKTGGTYFMQDISAAGNVSEDKEHPLGVLLFTVSLMHCMTVSLAQGGMGLGTMWGRKKAIEMLNEAGFHQIEIKNFEHDIQNDYYIIKK